MWSGHSCPLPLTYAREKLGKAFEKADWERAALKGSFVEGHDFSRAVKPPKTSRASGLRSRPCVSRTCGCPIATARGKTRGPAESGTDE